MAKKKAKITYRSWQPLKVGDIVDVIAPGFSVTDEKLKGGIEFLQSLGLKPRVPEDLFGPDVICSQKDEIRFKHLRQALTASDAKAIWCLRGGYGAIRLIENLAKLKLPKINKVFIGYSDATTLHNYMNQFWHFSTLHGPLLDRLGQHTLPLEQANEIADVLFGTQKQVVFKNLVPLNKLAQKNAVVKGAVVGGNLAVTQTHLGTKFFKAPKNQILFFEDIGERGYKVDKMLKHLELAGYFKSVKAIVFGEFVEGNESSGENHIPAVLERFAKALNIPMFTGIAAGHGQKQRPVPLYTYAELSCGKSGRLTIDTGAKSL